MIPNLLQITFSLDRKKKSRCFFVHSSKRWTCKKEEKNERDSFKFISAIAITLLIDEQMLSWTKEYNDLIIKSRRPLIRNCQKISSHRLAKTFLVLFWRDDGRRSVLRPSEYPRRLHPRF